jgi:hypothetical protein
MTSPATTTYEQAAGTFDHSPIAALPAYAAVRKALNDLAGQGGDCHIKLAALLDAARDMVITTPYADVCDRCHEMRWPHAAERDGGWLACSYRCPCGNTWTCNYAANITAFI